MNLSARFEHVCVPTQTTDAYFRAITTNTSSYRLLQGPMNVYMNNFFIASSNLRETGPKEVFKLYLGIDDGIKVEHQPNVLAEKEQGGMPFGRKTKLETTTLTTIIKNLKDTPVRVLVFYQKPFTSNADLKIKIEEPRTSNNPEVKVDEFNILSFENVIPPKKDYTCSFKYSMEYPVELKLTSTPQRGVKGEMRI
uniref:DUF4139 domain-containing protein n=1 Tax=Arcella intermedia TaxID=1963864 RepID=A0A6B2LC34_9EUKA